MRENLEFFCYFPYRNKKEVKKRQMKKGFLFLIGFVIFTLMSVVSVSATNSSTPAAAYVTINGFISLSVNPGLILFGNMVPGESNKSATNDPFVITIGNETNVDFVNVTTKANSTLFMSAGKNFSVSYLKWNTDEKPQTNYSTIEMPVFYITVYGQNHSMYHRLTIPSGQESGGYMAGIIVTAKDT